MAIDLNAVCARLAATTGFTRDDTCHYCECGEAHDSMQHWTAIHAETKAPGSLDNPIERDATPDEAFDRLRDLWLSYGKGRELHVGSWAWDKCIETDAGIVLWYRLRLSVPVLEALTARGILRREFGGPVTYGQIDWYTLPVIVEATL